MMGVDIIAQIRRAYFEQQRSIKEIVRTLSVSRATVRKVIRGQRVLKSMWRDILSQSAHKSDATASVTPAGI